MATDFEQRYIKARKSVVEADFMHLNEMQKEAVMTTQGPLLLLAGAGSGKTTVLINRILNILRYGSASDTSQLPDNACEEDIEKMCGDNIVAARLAAAFNPCPPWNILAITFTNKAAAELKSRLEANLGAVANDIWAQTFHSACVRILRRNAEKIGYTTSFTIYDSQDSQSVMKRIIKALDVDEKNYPVRMVLSVVSKAKDKLQLADAFLEAAKQSGDARQTVIANCYKAYEKQLRDADAMDFDDLILNAVRLLQEDDDIRSYYQKKFKYVMVDEYQDTNHLQYLLVSLLSGGYGNICVVGDDDQSIYKFRGATIENILSFESEYQNARVIKLEQNYRSTVHILAAANAVIKNNTERKGKNLWTDGEEGELPNLHLAYNQDEEAQFVADKILEGYAGGMRWDDHAVLYRLNSQSNAMEYAFKRRGIPYRVYGGMRFFDRAEIKDLLAYLNVISNPQDDLRLLRIINTPTRGIGAASIEAVAQIASAEGSSLYDVINHVEDYPQLKKPSASLRLFIDMINSLIEKSGTIPVDELYDEVVARTGYLKALEAKDTQENITKAENVRELKSNILNYISETADPTLFGFLDEISLYTDLDNLDKNADCVSMMTIHSSKGLEFPVVFMVGVEEGLFPSMRSIGSHEDMEEERRLCYVAITRAKERLYISSAMQRMLMGKTTNNRISRFAEEIPEEHIKKDYIPKGRSFSDTTFGAEQRPAQTQSKFRPVITSETASAPLPDYKTGDSVMHKSFGEGEIINMTAMGGDHLVEISFNSVGTKRLMLKAAARLMQKL